MTGQRGAALERTIRRSDPLPYYVQLADILRAGITAGRWAPGELLPSEAELGATYGISRTAVRQALQELVIEGLVQKEKGRGTFVALPKVDLVVEDVRGFFEEMRARGETISTEVLRQEVVAVPPAVAPKLRVRMGSDVVLLERVRKVGGEPIVQVRTYLPAPRFAPLAELDMREQTLYGVLADRFGVHPSRGSRRVEAIAADGELAANLEVPPGAPLLQLTAVNDDQDGLAFEHFVAWFRGDRSSFEVMVTARDQLDVFVGR